MRNFKCSDFLRILTNGSQQLKIKKYEKKSIFDTKKWNNKNWLFFTLFDDDDNECQLVQFLGKEEFKKYLKKRKKKVSGVVWGFLVVIVVLLLLFCRLLKQEKILSKEWINP